MASTTHLGRLRCPRCKSDAVRAETKVGCKFQCHCICGHIYISGSVAAGASFNKLQQAAIRS